MTCKGPLKWLATRRALQVMLVGFDSPLNTMAIYMHSHWSCHQLISKSKRSMNPSIVNATIPEEKSMIPEENSANAHGKLHRLPGFIPRGWHVPPRSFLSGALKDTLPWSRGLSRHWMNWRMPILLHPMFWMLCLMEKPTKMDVLGGTLQVGRWKNNLRDHEHIILNIRISWGFWS